ncbi:MAG: hypothetical protein DRN57_04210 [Thermoplasmata archaeon]|nr:MAG: hypothetical protein DRN57_04210 [Thermoplasmata archaeon]
MGAWEEVTFEDLYEIPSRNGLNKPKRVRGSGTKMVNMGELFAYPRIRNPEMERVPLTDNERKKSILKSVDLLFARQSLVREGAGKCSIVMETPEPTTFESHLIRVRLDKTKVNPIWYFYYFMSYEGMGNVRSLVMDVAAAGIRGSELAKLKVPKPPKEIQDKIASILSNYDELIENNSKRIALLTEMSKTIFEEWFVNYLYPGHEENNMIEAEIGPIPRGWETGRFDKYIKFAKGRTVSDLQQEKEINYQPYLLIEGLKTGQYQYTADKTITAEEQDTLMVMDGSNSGDVYIGYSGTVGSTLGIYTPIDSSKISPYYVFYLLKCREEEIKSKNTGAAVPHANKDYINSMTILAPDGEVMSLFDSIVSANHEQIMNLKKQIAILRDKRDLLIPKLISGELDVSELDIKIPEDAS